MATEVEIKLHMNDSSQIDDIMSDPDVRDHMREDFKRVNMMTKYYDTPDWDLYKAGFMLRIRTEDERVIVSLKEGTIDKEEKAGLCVRHQWICSSQEIEGVIDRLISCGAPWKIAEITAGKPIVNVCSAEFTRTLALLYLEEGIVLELAMDIGTINAGGQSSDLLEMELEILYGKVNFVRPFVDALGDRHSLTPATQTKLDKGYELACRH